MVAGGRVNSVAGSKPPRPFRQVYGTGRPITESPGCSAGTYPQIRQGSGAAAASAATLSAMDVFGAALVCMGLLRGDQGPWTWPLRPVPHVVRGFTPPALPWGAGHRGVDLAAAPGSTVYAAGAGQVTFAGSLAGRGVVTITHGELRTTYLPVRASVRAGSRVTAGQAIGVVENVPGHCPAGCLHWGLLRGPVYLDPLALLGRAPVRLLPVWPFPGPPAPGSRSVPGPPRAVGSRPATGPYRVVAAAEPTGAGALALLFTLVLLRRGGEPGDRPS